MAIAWLKNQLVPNDLVPEPEPARRHLIVSYRIPPQSKVYPYLYGRTAIYDNALAAIAFTMAGEAEKAAFILHSLRRLTRPDGSLWFTYNTNNSWPSAGDDEGALTRSGSIAWVGYAAVFYLERQAKGNPGYLEQDREAKTFLGMARSIGDHLLGLQVLEPKDLRYGLITGGENTFFLKVQNDQVIEVFKRCKIDWVSTEHNIDSYFFLRDLGRLTDDPKYLTAAEKIKDGMLRAWSKSDHQYYRGVRTDYIDTVLALDGASWGSVFSGAIGRSEYALESLKALESYYPSSDLIGTNLNIRVSGYKPYSHKEVYDEETGKITPRYFPENPSLTWKELQGVWGEGSLGVAVAYLKTGQEKQARRIIDEVLKLQDSKGGVLYFSKEIPHEFINYPSVASTAWLVMALSMLENPEILNDFWAK